MATYLGIEIPANILSGSWLNMECNNTAADYRYNTQLQTLREKTALVRAAALNANTMADLDAAESALWLLSGALNLLYPKARSYAAWFQVLIENTGILGGARPESCNQNTNTLSNQVLYAVNIRNIIQFEFAQTQNLLATIQGLQADEVEEELIQNTLNNAAAEIQSNQLEVGARLQEVRAAEFINNLQQILLPLLAVSIAVVIFTRKR